MKHLTYTLAAVLLVTRPLMAYDGHNHGNTAFENQQTATVEFTLSPHQIKNLQLRSAPVQIYDFYQTIEIPVILDTMHNDKPLVHGFIYEGQDILKVKKGQNVTFILDAFPKQYFNGKIVRVDKMLDPQTRLYSVYADSQTALPQNSQGLKGSMTIKTTPLEKALGINAQAVQGGFGTYFVFIDHGDHFEKREVSIGHKNGNIIEISGVKEGEKIITRGAYQLRYAQGTPFKETDIALHGEN